MDKLLRPEKLEVEPNINNATQQWKHWHRSFINFLEVAKANEDKEQLNLLINYLCPAVYEYISECSTYKDAIKILESLYVKPKNEIFARHSLSSRRQESSESIDQYLQVLQQMSKECNFKSVSADQNRDDFIRDSFISGLNSPLIRQRLLENNTLSLDEAFNKARSLEMAQHHSESYSSSFSAINAAVSKYTDVQLIRDDPDCLTGSAITSKCYFCGYDGHPRYKCLAKNSICHLCKKKGHFSKVCKSRDNSIKTSAAILATISAASPGCLSKAILQVEVDGVMTDALIDTGSSDSYISSKVIKDRKLSIFPIKANVAMASTSLSSKVLGYCTATLQILEHVYKHVKLMVMENLCADVIIGHDILSQHKIIEMVFGGKRSSLSICSLAIANVEPTLLCSNLSSDCKPIAIKSRLFSQEELKFIKEETQRLLSENVIEPSDSPWRAQVLITTNENHKKRMVIDYSQTINRFTQLDAYPLPKIEDIVNKVAQYEVFSTIDLRSAYHQIPINENEKIYTAFEACGGLYQFRRIPFGVTNGVACFQRTIDKIIKQEGLQDTYAYLDDVTVCGVNNVHHDHNLKQFLNAAKKYNLTLNKEKCTFSSNSINLLGYNITKKTIKPDPERIRPLLDLPTPVDSTSLKRIMGMFAHYSKWVPKFSEKIQPLVHCKKFPMDENENFAFKTLKQDIANAVVTSIDENAMFTVETDASDFAIAAQLSQLGQPVAFFSRTLSKSEQKHSSVEKEAYAIVEALRKWRHFLIGRHFKLITDQRSVTFMFDNKNSGKIKNDKIMRWRLELSSYKYDIIYRPGSQNTVADAFSRVCSATEVDKTLYNLHNSLCHPGITRLYHWVRCKNMPFSVEDIRSVTSRCPVCAELKPRFHKYQGTLIKATSPFERLNIDFKGPLPTSSNNRYILTIIDEYSRFPFAFPCSDMSSATVIKCLRQIFSIFGTPSYIHSDRGISFLSFEVKSFLDSHGVARSRTTAYNPQGNGQCERYNGIIWKTIQLALKSQNMVINQWELVLQDALHSIRSLLCTATNCTPHERMFNYTRRSANGSSTPSWLSTPGPVFLKKFRCQNKYGPLVEEVELLDSNSEYAHIRLSNGNETTVSVRHLAPRGDVSLNTTNNEEIPAGEINLENTVFIPQQPEIIPINNNQQQFQDSHSLNKAEIEIFENKSSLPSEGDRHDDRPLRDRKRPKYLEDFV